MPPWHRRSPLRIEPAQRGPKRATIRDLAANLYAVCAISRRSADRNRHRMYLHRQFPSAHWAGAARTGTGGVSEAPVSEFAPLRIEPAQRGPKRGDVSGQDMLSALSAGAART